ncbi:hypothetical protein [Deinococcus sp. KSM4-11]|nr:hypothetical protein [Deinococcus sp. KSM4-11]
MLGLIVLLTVFGSLADLARRQEHRTREGAERAPDVTSAVPQA